MAKVSKLIRRPLLTALSLIAFVWLPGCGKKEPQPTYNGQSIDTLSEAQKTALAHGAKAAYYSMKDHAQAAEWYRKSIQAEPANPQWKSFLASELYRVGTKESLAEAISIWQELAKGTGEEAERAKRWLVKAQAKR
jgi:hypothetical protein